jgi:hypothetical protein
MTLDPISATTTCVMWRGELLRSVRLLQGVRLSNLAVHIISQTIVIEPRTVEY